MSTNRKFLLESFQFRGRMLHTGELRLSAAGTELELGENIVDSYGKVRTVLGQDRAALPTSQSLPSNISPTQAGGNPNYIVRMFRFPSVWSNIV